MKRYVVTAIRPLSLSGQRVEVAKFDDHEELVKFLREDGHRLRQPMIKELEDKSAPTWSHFMS